jgi:hypothetical protein|tara:strand:+ start:264 stop:407 length:144 start_codon:yes stop_codon:yes gene_type:complete
MFLLCKLKDKKCAFCGSCKDQIHCGIAKGENKISLMNKCPLKPKKKK